MRLCRKYQAHVIWIPLDLSSTWEMVQGLADTGKSSPSHMKQLYSLCNTCFKTWKSLPNGTHNETVGEPYYFDYVTDFINGPVKARL